MKSYFNLLIIILAFSCTSNTKEPKKGNKINNHASVSNTGKTEPDSDGHKILNLQKNYRFEDFRTEIYKGKLKEPDFKDNPFADDQEYVNFIQNGCASNGINFNGHYTIIERGCGAECSHIFIVDRKTGKIFTDIQPNDGRYGYKYKIDSNLLIANSSLFVDDKFKRYIDYWCKPEFYVWNKNNFLLLKEKTLHNKI